MTKLLKVIFIYDNGQKVVVHRELIESFGKMITTMLKIKKAKECVRKKQKQ